MHAVLTTSALVALSSFSGSALLAAGDCTCQLYADQAQPGPGSGGGSCTASLTVTFSVPEPTNGTCWTEECQPSNCTTKVEVTVSGTMTPGCQVNIFQDLTLIGRGNTGNGATFTAMGYSVLECDDFDAYSVNLGPVGLFGDQLVSKTTYCLPCEAYGE